MAMSPAGARHQAEINTTPLIDVLLVLLIIFMIIAPSVSVGLSTAVPQLAATAQAPPTSNIVLTVLADGAVQLNQEMIPVGRLDERLTELFARAAGQAIFIRADKDLDFAQVADVIDVAKGAGFDRVALMR